MGVRRQTGGMLTRYNEDELPCVRCSTGCLTKHPYPLCEDCAEALIGTHAETVFGDWADFLTTVGEPT